MIVDLLLVAVEAIFLAPLVALLPVFTGTLGYGGLETLAGNVNAMMPVYWPLFFVSTVLQLTVTLLPFALGLWLWKVAKP